MADKQVNFPLTPLPSWANDDNISDPGRPWDATPTKAEPGAGKRDDGYLPEENPAAQHLNQQFNEAGKWIQYLSTIQVQNWFDSGRIGMTGEACVYDEGIGSWIFGGRADIVATSRDGQTFQSGTSGVVGQTWEYAASKRPEDGPVHTGARTLLVAGDVLNPNIVVEFTGGFAGQTLPAVGTSQCEWVVWDRINQLWIICGRDDVGGTPAAAFWYDSTPISGFTKVLPAAAANSVTPIMLASGEDGAGSGLNVAIGDGAAPNFDVWTSSDGTTWSAATPTGITAGEDARSIMWCPARQLFVMTTNDSVYTSTNGTAWSRVFTKSIGSEFQTKCIASDDGAIWVTALDFGEPTGIAYSYDGGGTWRFVAVPPAENGSTDPIHRIRYSRNAGRFGAVWVDGPGTPTNPANFALSLALGEPVITLEGAFSPPTVT